MFIALALALLAGGITTTAGLGGGHVLVLGLAILWGPLTALAITGPALLVGNLHRLWLFRRHLGGPLPTRYALGAFPGALLGGLSAAALPERALLAMMMVFTFFAIAKHLRGFKLTLPTWTLVPGGSLVGFVAATGGGGGVIASPMLMGAGATGGHYMAAMGTGAVAIHIGRMMGYSLQGSMSISHVTTGLFLAMSITIGNQVGMKIRDRLTDTGQSRAEIFALLVAATLAVGAAV